MISGECFCGQVSYQIDGSLRDARSCHCSRCRKAFSSQASAYALVEPTEFKWLSGESLLSSYQGESGFGLRFCKVCGSTLCGTYQGAVHGVTMGCVNGDPDIELGMHIFVGSKARWESLPEATSEGAPQYYEGPPQAESDD
ncbi:MAG: GFA family protein [Motiliproteus sp.]|nr:GFA family protein [Motiliproteus sp.]MCW9051055.1 GFA family protein [Motiliproteus sp.]